MNRILILLITSVIVACTTPYQVDTEDIVKYEEIYYDYYSQGKYEEAIDRFKTFIEDYPWSSKVDNSWYYIGRSYQKKQPPDTLNAINAFENVPLKSSQYNDAQGYINDLKGGN